MEIINVRFILFFLLMVTSINSQASEYKLFSSESIRWNRITIKVYHVMNSKVSVGSIRAMNGNGIGQLVVNRCHLGDNSEVVMKNWYGNEAHVQGIWGGEDIYCDIDVGIPKGSNDSDDNYIAYIDARYTDGKWSSVGIDNGGGCQAFESGGQSYIYFKPDCVDRDDGPRGISLDIPQSITLSAMNNYSSTLLKATAKTGSPVVKFKLTGSSEVQQYTEVKSGTTNINWDTVYTLSDEALILQKKSDISFPVGKTSGTVNIEAVLM